jgi:hypothetical protein
LRPFLSTVVTNLYGKLFDTSQPPSSGHASLSAAVTNHETPPPTLPLSASALGSACVDVVPDSLSPLERLAYYSDEYENEASHLRQHFKTYE